MERWRLDLVLRSALTITVGIAGLLFMGDGSGLMADPLKAGPINHPPPAINHAASAPTVRVRDITRVQSVRANQIVGYGLVVGLNGTGDSQQSRFTLQSAATMLQRFGVTVDARLLKTKNAAAVVLTTEIPAFAKNGSRLDVTVSSIGDATSLQGGSLLQTPLLGADEEVYAVAQGPVSIGGFAAGGGGSSVTKNHPTTGRVPGGALVEREIPTTLADWDGTLLVNLSMPDFENATRIAAALNAHLGAGFAVAADAATVRVRPPAEYQGDPVRLIAAIGELPVQPSTPAKIILNERTGTVIIGGNVRIAPVAVAHGSLTVEIMTELQVSQPAPLAEKARTVVVPQTGVNAGETQAAVMELQPGTTMAELVRALNALRVTPRDIVAIIQAIKGAGALFAELELQ
jgi:flagellar P-ring protein precursor FlgI